VKGKNDGIVSSFQKFTKKGTTAHNLKNRSLQWMS